MKIIIEDIGLQEGGRFRGNFFPRRNSREPYGERILS